MSVSPTISGPTRPLRIRFIDVLRAFAILMMLQGHFVDTMLAPYYRDLSDPVYWTWHFMRGLTAPIFFTSTGLVFIYLLLKDGRPLALNTRVKKGLRRGGFLILLGYLLKFNLFAVLFGHFYPWYFAVDVLHCIGLALLALIGLYALHSALRIPLWPMLLLGGLAVFLLDPNRMATDWSGLPRWLAHYFTQDYGSVFTPVPWIGYTLIGGALGYALHHRPRLAFTHWFPLALAAAGYVISTYSSDFLATLDDLTGWHSFQDLADSNGLLWRLGHVLVTVAIFMWVIGRLSSVPKLITTIGSETLTIYSVHYVVLYGTWFGIGLSPLLRASLSPWVCALSAALFVGSFVVLIYYIDPIRAWLDRRVYSWYRYQLRVGRVRLWRLLTHRLPELLQQAWSGYHPSRRLARWVMAARYLF